MKGTCLKCGCTRQRACPGGCEWIDPLEDLCSTCAQELMRGDLLPSDLVEAGLMLRALRAALFETAGMVAEIAAIAGLYDVARANAAEPEIWTP